MPELTDGARRLVTTWRGDLLLAVAMLGWALALLAEATISAGQRWTALIFVLPYCAALAIRRLWPVPAVVLACAALLAVRPLGSASLVNGWLTIPFAWTPFLFGYQLGASAGLVTGLAGVALLTGCLQVENVVFNPIFLMITIGPWLAGRIARSRRTLTRQLQARNRELLAEQERFARESVRYERARIARELHDIIAHCLSVTVVQASAGQRVPETDRSGMAEALSSVAESAAQAREEIGRLVELLGGELPPGAAPSLAMVDELVRRAATTGLDVSCRFAGACGELAPAASEAAYRVVQEALTNALKHAPGAPVSVTVGPAGRDVAVRVANAAPRAGQSGLEPSGAHYGLAAMRERVTACGGRLEAGSAPDGGWHVLALLPACAPAEPPWPLYRSKGYEHELMLTLPAGRGSASGPDAGDPGPGRTLRLFLFRGPGRDFREADRAMLTLLRPHLLQAYLDAERRRHPLPDLTPRHWQLLNLLAAGHTNTQMARRLGVSEGTIRTHLENIYARLQVSSRTAAVTRAFASQDAYP